MCGIQGSGEVGSAHDISLNRVQLRDEMLYVAGVLDGDLWRCPWERLRLSFLPSLCFGGAAGSGREVESGVLTAGEGHCTAGSASPGFDAAGDQSTSSTRNLQRHKR